MVVGLTFHNRTVSEVIVPSTDYLGKTIVLALSSEEIRTLRIEAKMNYNAVESSILKAVNSVYDQGVTSLDDVLFIVDDDSNEAIQRKYSSLKNVIIVGRPTLV